MLRDARRRHLRGLDLRVYVGDGESHEHTERLLSCPPGPGEGIRAWAARVFGEQKFGIILSSAEAVSEALARRYAAFLRPLLVQAGFRYDGIALSFFTGNYDYTPFGIHKIRSCGCSTGTSGPAARTCTSGMPRPTRRTGARTTSATSPRRCSGAATSSRWTPAPCSTSPAVTIISARRASCRSASSSSCRPLAAGVFRLVDRGGLLRVDTDTATFIEFIGNAVLPGVDPPTGASVDVQGQVWLVDQHKDGGGAFVYDPLAQSAQWFGGLNGPYTYSDMTGFALKNVAPQ